MTTRDDAFPIGTPCWVDLSVADVSAARIFYEDLFGWQIEEGRPEFGGYSNATKDGKMVCGLTPTMAPEQPNAWMTYIAVDDAAAAMDRVREHGGQVVAEPMDVMGLGTMAIAVDSDGAPFGVWKAGTHTGFQRYNETGTVSWNEHMGPDLDDAKSFYGNVFGWTYNDVSTEADGFKYSTFKAADDHEAGGLGELSVEDLRAPWMVYFSVDNADEAVDQVVKLGGNVLSPPVDTPYGRLAVVSDNQDAVFSVIQAPVS